MISHWVVFPSAITERANEALKAWHEMGYKSVVYQDLGSKPCDADIVRVGRFPGYYRIINHLVEAALCEGADLVTCASDDMRPDPVMGAQVVGQMYFKVFPNGEGVFQATGDMQGQDSTGKQAAARICGSPTLGRDWIVKSYEGKGPLNDQYMSYFADEELYEVASALGMLWQEPNVTVDHQHWSFGRMKKQRYHDIAQLNWIHDSELFQERKAQGFPKSGLLQV